MNTAHPTRNATARYMKDAKRLLRKIGYSEKSIRAYLLNLPRHAETQKK
jgi:hypothetical protein